MKPYPKKLDTPSRMNRKHARREVYWANYKATKLAKKKLRAERRELLESAEE
jgi:hypothetical protein